MDSKNIIAVVTGGASGLGEAAAREIIRCGGSVVIIDLNKTLGEAVAAELGERALFSSADITDENEIVKSLEMCTQSFGGINVVVNAAGILMAGKTIGKKGPMPLDRFELSLKVNLLGTFNVIRLASMMMADNEPDSAGERGVIINTASVAAFEGQVGQAAYSAAKAGIVGMTLPISRDLADAGIRNVTIAPGIFETPMVDGMSEAVRESLIGQSQFPKRFGKPSEFARLVMSIIENPMINGTTIRLDGAVRMAPR